MFVQVSINGIVILCMLYTNIEKELIKIMNNSIDKLFEPSGVNSAFTYSGSSFAEYIQHMRAIIKSANSHESFLLQEKLLQTSSPFEYIPQEPSAYNSSTKKIKRGVLLIHGLFDSPHMMLSIGEYFKEQNYLVRALLLPGHGTVPGDLLKISYHEWLKALIFGVNSFKNEVEELYLCGFSTGAALATYYAQQYSGIAGLILFAPALKLRAPLQLITLLNHHLPMWASLDWYTKQTKANDIYGKYQSFTFNAAYQVYLLGQEIAQQTKLEQPIFMVISADDELISMQGTLDFFAKHQHKKNQLIIYSNKIETFPDERIEVRSSFYPEESILNFSHIALPIAFDHPSYGREQLKKLAADKANIYFGRVSMLTLTEQNYLRLTYNPNFYELLARVKEFIHSC